jgi:nitroimidazol reductase NimA-like FMN-containing flavoprotein (pyridoxamine 5'-phosphate oxidase superfamily)
MASETKESTAVARRLVDANMYMTLATADEGGRPWASPVWFAPHGDDRFLWVSAPETRHSRNIAARREIAIVIFDSTVSVGAAEALYVEAVAEELHADALEQAIVAYSQHSERSGARAWQIADVLPPSGLRLYRATASAQSVLGPGDERLPVRQA